ncbi:CAP domain-containing protein [Ruegeria meonggei]|uniref:Cysteine-rich secretory protein family protein n=1 Tax=Ruegeria meonggei TaxID=1446476 RepID=A0A1X6ZHT4_9RHOB|nr:CAP domain-containing protein [Ruegeria meonggei]SLN51552.1 Cysteine-rich secretory protein family protein [Ruegeria meonggei]
MSTANTVEQEMLALINNERTSRGLTPLQLETRLNDSSEDHSTWMLDRDTFSHTGSGGSSAAQRMEDAGFDFDGSWRSGENIAWQSERGAEGISDDVDQLHQSLMNSPGHRANILNPDYEYIGIGIEEGDFNGWDAVMVTQNFATTDGQVVLDSGDAPVPPVDMVEDPETENPETDVTETPVTESDENTEEPETEVTDNDTPAEETPEVDLPDTDVTDDPEVTETEDPAAETPDAEVTDADAPEEETPEVDEPATGDPEVTDVEDTDPPETDITDPEGPDTETPGTDVTDATTGDCFDVEAFLAAIEGFVNDLLVLVDDFRLTDTEMATTDPMESDDFMLAGDFCDDTKTIEDITPGGGAAQLETSFIPILVEDGCMMDFV